VLEAAALWLTTTFVGLAVFGEGLTRFGLMTLPLTFLCTPPLVWAAVRFRQLEAAMWDAEGHRTIDTVARAAGVIAAKAGFALPAGKTFIIVKEDRIGKAHRFSSEKLSPVLAIFKYSGFDNLLKMVSEIFEVGGKGHSVGIASFDDDHIHRLASMAPVSRIMVRQPNVRGNAGSFTNGMPQTASLGCGTWGGNITSENISVKHYMNTTWVSRPIPEDKPSEQELLGEFYNSETFDPEPALR